MIRSCPDSNKLNFIPKFPSGKAFITQRNQFRVRTLTHSAENLQDVYRIAGFTDYAENMGLSYWLPIKQHSQDPNRILTRETTLAKIQ